MENEIPLEIAVHPDDIPLEVRQQALQQATWYRRPMYLLRFPDLLRMLYGRPSWGWTLCPEPKGARCRDCWSNGAQLIGIATPL